MKKKEWINSNHMKFDSPLKIFNRQIGGITTGNVVDNVEYGLYIRSWWELECNGFVNEPGHLFRFDIEGLAKWQMPYYIRDFMEKLMKERKQSVILYNFHHWTPSPKHYNARRIDDGWVATDPYHNHKEIKRWHIGNWKQQAVLEEAIKYVTN